MVGEVDITERSSSDILESKTEISECPMPEFDPFQEHPTIDLCASHSVASARASSESTRWAWELLTCVHACPWLNAVDWELHMSRLGLLLNTTTERPWSKCHIRANARCTDGPSSVPELAVHKTGRPHAPHSLACSLLGERLGRSSQDSKIRELVWGINAGIESGIHQTRST